MNTISKNPRNPEIKTQRNPKNKIRNPKKQETPSRPDPTVLFKAP
jgi:hypothetical protein